MTRTALAVLPLLCVPALTGCSGDAEGTADVAAPSKAATSAADTRFCEEVVEHRDEYWAVAKGLTSVQGVKDLLGGNTDVSALTPMWRDLAAAAPGRIKGEVVGVYDNWATMIEAYENKEWLTLTRTVRKMTGPMAEVNAFVRVTCGRSYGPLGG